MVLNKRTLSILLFLLILALNRNRTVSNRLYSDRIRTGYKTDRSETVGYDWVRLRKGRSTATVAGKNRKNFCIISYDFSQTIIGQILLGFATFFLNFL